jgi:hypothetical protein
VNPRTSVGNIEKFVDPTGTCNSYPSVQPVASRYTDCAVYVYVCSYVQFYKCTLYMVCPLSEIVGR